MNNKLFLILLLIYIAFNAIAQDVLTYESPNIKIYTRDDYSALDQNWNITQDSMGFIYVANNQALLIFDGENWQSKKMKNVWGLKANKNKEVYYGADNTFGKVTYGKQGEIILKSFASQLNKGDRNTGVIQDIFFIGDTTYFVGFNNIYVFHKDSFAFNIAAESRIFYSFSIDGNLYITHNKGKLLVVNNNQINRIQIDKNKFDSRIRDVIKYKDKTIVISDKGIFYSTEKNVKFYKAKYQSLDNDLSIEVKKGNFDRFRLLSDNNLVFISRLSGLLIYNIETGYKTFINKKSGLSTNFILNVFEDNQKNLWLPSYEGINYVELNFPVKTISAGEYTSNIITSFNKTKNGEIVYTTLNGVYKLRKDANSNKIFIHNYNLQGSYVSTVIYDNKIYVSSVIGVGEVKDGEFKQLVNFEVGYVLRKLEFDSNYMILGGGDGLSILKYENNTIKQIHHIKNTNVDSRYIVEDNGYLWFSREKGIVSRFNLNQIYEDSVIIEDFYLSDSTILNNIYIYKICNNLIAQDKDIVKKFDYKTSEFIISERYSYLNDIDPIELSVKDGNTNWISNTNELYNIDCKTGKSSRSHIFLKRFKDIKTSSIYNDEKNEKIWIGGTNKIGVIDEKKLDSNLYTFRISIRKIEVNDSVYFHGYNLNDSIAHLFNRKSKFLFYFAAQYYRAAEQNKYSYKLDGYDNSWSEWSDITFANYTNLEHGEYVFKIKAKNVFGKESEIKEYKFSVESAFYQKWYAHLLFLVIFALIIVLVIYINGKRLKAINLNLEKQIEERTIEVKEKNKELEKLSIVASETDNSVLIYDENYHLEWINEGEIKNFGYTLEQIHEKFGKSILEISFYPQIKEIIKEIENTKKGQHYNSKGKRKDGSLIWSRTTLTPILDSNNKIIKIIAIDSDITELKNAEEKITQQNTHIRHSLEYAKKIQDAVLPSLESLQKEFNDAFILFKPRDIVSGDFFWMHTNGDKTIVATADCTGHGVPGGFMSMIGNTMMNEIVKEKNITSPSYILNLMDDKMNSLFEESGSEQADGMDVAIAVIDKKEGVIEVASANQSLYVVDDGEVFEFEGDMWSVGGVFSKKAVGTFKTKVFNITGNTSLYMSSDGYQDQFGGEDDTKILKSKFIDILVEISELQIKEQKEFLSNYLINWQGKGKQTDDILVIGIKV